MSAKLAEHLQKLGYPGGDELGYQVPVFQTLFSLMKKLNEPDHWFFSLV
jgi:hypothetical protein